MFAYLYYSSFESDHNNSTVATHVDHYAEQLRFIHKTQSEQQAERSVGGHVEELPVPPNNKSDPVHLTAKERFYRNRAVHNAPVVNRVGSGDGECDVCVGI